MRESIELASDGASPVSLSFDLPGLSPSLSTASPFTHRHDKSLHHSSSRHHRHQSSERFEPFWPWEKMMDHSRLRFLTVVACTTTALACGSNYVYSAWAPQFAEKLKLSATESNMIGGAGNLGMYASGIPIGLLIDARGPRPGILIGLVALFLGYWPMQNAYEKGEGSVAALMFCYFLTGFGSCSAFSAAIKTAASNFPTHRGTATAFPLAAFGLSAFFFSSIASLSFPHDTHKFLQLLTYGAVCLVAVSAPFIKIIPVTSNYAQIHQEEHERHSDELYRSRSNGTSHPHRGTTETGTPNERTHAEPHDTGAKTTDADETASLLSDSSQDRLGPSAAVGSGREYGDEEVIAKSNAQHDTGHTDVRGAKLVMQGEFWLLFAILGMLTGVGLMTINNIGNDVKALWSHYDDSATPEFISRTQIIHVSILSLCSFTGRLASGIGSDFLVSHLQLSRYYCLFISSLLFTTAQVFALKIENPHYLVLLTVLTGLAYGALFGVMPSITAHTFGVKGLALNWGAMTMAPVLSGLLFNFVYGKVYDSKSVVLEGGERDCSEGLDCYQTAYGVTLIASLIGVALCIFGIWKDGKKNRGKGHGHVV